jgi:hypothetical protein
MAVQIAMAYAVKDVPWLKVLVAAYVVSGTASQNLFTAQHELSHFLAFRKPLYNKILSLASNCPLVVPMATSFRKYHQEHHSHLVRCLPRCMVINFRMSCLVPLSVLLLAIQQVSAAPRSETGLTYHDRLLQCRKNAFADIAGAVKCFAAL